MEMIRHSLTPAELEKAKRLEEQLAKCVDVKPLQPEGNRHDRRAAGRVAELQQRIKDLST